MAAYQLLASNQATMKIMLKKFGDILLSRQARREAWSALQPLLKDLAADEMIEVSFVDVAVFTPSWGDEFITPLETKYPGRVKLLPSDNASVKATFQILHAEKDA